MQQIVNKYTYLYVTHFPEAGRSLPPLSPMGGQEVQDTTVQKTSFLRAQKVPQDALFILGLES